MKFPGYLPGVCGWDLRLLATPQSILQDDPPFTRLHHSNKYMTQKITVLPGIKKRDLSVQEISNRTHWTDPEKTWVSNSSIAAYLGSVGIRSHSILDGIYHDLPLWFIHFILSTTHLQFNWLRSHISINVLWWKGFFFPNEVLEATFTVDKRLKECKVSIPWRIHGTGIFTYMNGWFLWFSCRYISGQFIINP